MLDHFSITVRDIDKARDFYDAVFSVLNINKVYDQADALGYGERNDGNNDENCYLSIFQSSESNMNKRRHWCFKASSRTIVDRFYESGIENGGEDDGAPGLRSHYHPTYYAAFLLDPDGNRIEAVCHRPEESNS